MMPISLAILAGGKSRRMGVNKAFLRLGDKTVLEHLLARVQTLEWESIFLVANQAEDYAYLNLPIYPDVVSDKAALGGIYSALEQSPTVDTFVLACDMPLINPALIAYLIASAENQTFDAFVPRFKGKGQALHAIYRKTCLAQLKNQIAMQQLKLETFCAACNSAYLDEVDYQHIDPHGLSFTNINTPDDFSRVQKQFSAQ